MEALFGAFTRAGSFDFVTLCHYLFALHIWIICKTFFQFVYIMYDLYTL
jgi:hypothetical protein